MRRKHKEIIGGFKRKFIKETIKKFVKFKLIKRGEKRDLNSKSELFAVGNTFL